MSTIGACGARAVESSPSQKPANFAAFSDIARSRQTGRPCIALSASTPDLAVALGRRVPTTPKSQIKNPNLARLFIARSFDC